MLTHDENETFDIGSYFLALTLRFYEGEPREPWIVGAVAWPIDEDGNHKEPIKGVDMVLNSLDDIEQGCLQRNIEQFVERTL